MTLALWPLRRFRSPVTLNFRGRQPRSIYSESLGTCLPKACTAGPTRTLHSAVWPTVSSASLYMILTIQGSQSCLLTGQLPNNPLHNPSQSLKQIRVVGTKLWLPDCLVSKACTLRLLGQEDYKFNTPHCFWGNLVMCFDKKCPDLKPQGAFILKERLGWLGVCPKDPVFKQWS